MDFFQQQDQARRSTKILVILFLLAVSLLIILTNVLVVVTLWVMDEQLVGNYQAYQQSVQTLNYHPTLGLFEFFDWRRFGLISLAVTGVIGCAVLFKSAQLSGGGKRVAEQLGGSRIQPNTNDKDEKLALNVVEEMAIASGMPVPAVYLLKDELGLNAFAAGSTPADAVIGITRGCLEQLDREQLQGVVAHEFSHILNGDMRLNIRLIAILHGILFVGLIGEILLRSGGRSRFRSRGKSDGNSIALLGLALLIIGWLGRFFGSWIKSAVSQQREYLADASAVQFTRNPGGIADALKIIGGYQPSALVESPRASEMSHLFFGQAITAKMFTTHPPLTERIQRIEPHWDGQFIVRQVKNTDHHSANNEAGPAGKSKSEKFTDVVSGAILVDAAFQNPGQLQDSNSGIPELLTKNIHEPFSAIAVLFALLLSDDQAIQAKQQSYIELTKIRGLSIESMHLLPAISSLDKSHRLPLIQLALPALKCMSAEQYKVVCRTLLLLIRADNRYDLFEWCLYQLVRHYLDPEFGKVKASQPKHRKVKAVSNDFNIVLSLLCHYGETSEDLISAAFHKGANSAGLYTLSLMDVSQCNLDAFIDATKNLADCFPLLKPRLLKALKDAASHDGVISTVEREMITAIAAVMDSPLPQLD
jgi:Zn-dependent protease with chaperone function